MVSSTNKRVTCSKTSRPICTFLERMALSVCVRSWSTNRADLSLPKSSCAFSSLSNSSRNSFSTRSHSVPASSFSIFRSNSRKWLRTSFFSVVFSLSVCIAASSSCNSFTSIPLSDKVFIAFSASAKPLLICAFVSSIVCFLLVSRTFSTVKPVARKRTSSLICSEESTFNVTSTRLSAGIRVSTSSPVMTTSATCS